MPPNIAFSKEMMVDKAFELVRAEGLGGLSARRIAQAFGGSTNPLYRAFATMDELKAQVMARGKKYVMDFMLLDLPKEELFYNIGLRYLKLSQDESELFRIFFMTGSFLPGMENFEPPFDKILEAIKKDPHMAPLPEEEQKQVFLDMWTFTHGLISLSSVGAISGTDEKLRRALDRVGGALLSQRLGKPCPPTKENPL